MRTISWTLLVANLTLVAASVARAESPQMPLCVCNDDCKNKYPYSGICVDYGWGKRYCGWNNTGVPCTDGGPPAKEGGPPLKEGGPPPKEGGSHEGGYPKPDAWHGCGDALPSCSCDDDCKSFGLTYCRKSSFAQCGSFCSKTGPGIACGMKKDAGITPSPDAWVRGCRCNGECAGTSTPYCGQVGGKTVCTTVGPGISCSDDVLRSDYRVPSEAGTGGTPDRGCSVSGAPASRGAASALIVSGLALLLLTFARARWRRRDA